MKKIIQIATSENPDSGENFYALTEDGKVYLRSYETQKEFREQKDDPNTRYHKIKAYWKEILEEDIY